MNLKRICAWLAGTLGVRRATGRSATGPTLSRSTHVRVVAMLLLAIAAVSVQAQTRWIRAGGAVAAGGQEITVPVQFLAQGNENSVGFSLSFDPARVTYRGETLGTGAQGAAFFVNTNQASSGRVGFAFARSGSQLFAAGTNELVHVRFMLGTTVGDTTIGFGDLPVARETVDATANTLVTSYSNGVITITPLVVPAITTQPTNQTVFAGANVTMTAAATGSLPLSLQWYFETMPLTNSTNSTLTLTAVATNQSGNYRFVARNAGGSVTSSPALLTVLPPLSAPAIIQQPVSQVASTGETVVFTASAAGSAPLRYYWRFNNNNILGQTNTTLILSNLTTSQSGNYSMVASNSVGFAVSANGNLSVSATPRTVRALARTVPTAGDVEVPIELVALGDETAVGFSVAFDPTRLFFRSASISTGLFGAAILLNTNQAASGRVGIAITRPAGERFAAGVSPLAVVRFRAGDFAEATSVGFGDAPVQREIVDVNGTVRASAFSNGIVTILSTPPQIVTQPSSQTVPVFSTASFEVVAGGSVPLNFQWQCNGTNVPGANSPTLNLPNIHPTQAGGYRVIVSNAVGSLTSVVATLTVPRVVRIPSVSAATGNEIDVPVQLLAAGDENSLGLTLGFDPARLSFRELRSNSWPANATININSNLAGSGTLGVAIALPGGQTIPRGTQQVALLRFLLSAAPGTASWTFSDFPIGRDLVNTAAESLPVIYQSGSVTGALVRPAFTQQPAGTNVYAGATVSLRADASGSKPLTWRWVLNGTNIPGATNSTLTFSNVSIAAAGNYSVVASNSAGSTNSALALVQVLPPPSDLIPFALVAPAQTAAGHPVTLNWSVTNAGTSAAIGPWHETIYISDSPSGTPRQAVGTVTYSGSVNTNQTVARSATVTLPESASGTRYFVVMEDSDNWLQEIDEANNIAVATVGTELRNSDLEISTIAALASAKFGDTLGVTWAVKNIGTAPANSMWTDRLYLSTASNSLSGATLLRNVSSLSALQAGESYTNTQQVTIPLTPSSAAGTYFIVAVADYWNTQAESAESNNNRSKALALTLPSLPDLAVTNVLSPGTVLPGQSIAVSWAVTNKGATTAVGPWSEAVFISTDATIGADQLLGTFTFTNTLAPGAFVVRTQMVTLPLFGSGERWFAVRTDSGDTLIESDDTNNIAIGAAPSILPLAASLSLSPGTVTEGSSASATLTRNGNLTSGATFNLTSGNTNRVVVPASVTFAANQQAIGFTIATVNDTFVSGAEAVAIRATAAGYVAASNSLTVLENDTPTLTVSLPIGSLAENAGPNSAVGEVIRNTSTNSALTVNLVSSDSSKLLVPATVTIPAGVRSEFFLISAVDNLVPNAAARVTITATATGYANSPGSLMILDDDVPSVTLSLLDPTVAEGAANPATYLNITRNPVLASRARFAVQSSDSSVASVPYTATIEPNQESVAVPVSVANNNFVDGARSTTFTVTAIDDSTGATIPSSSVLISLTVSDDDGPTLAMSVGTDVISETGTTQGTVTRNTPATSNLVVSLQSGTPTEATIPPTVTIPTGQATASFTITGVSDGTGDGTKRVTFTASANGFNSGSAALNVSDIDLPDIRPVAVNTTNSAFTGAVVPISFTVTNSGLSDADGSWVDRVYLAKTPAGDGLQLVTQTFRSGGLALGASYTRTVLASMPQSVGDFYVIIVADEARALNDGNRQNNRFVSVTPITVSAAYRATIASDVTSTVSGTVIPLTGSAFNTTDSSPARNVRVTVRALVKGTRRVFDAWTDTNGQFSAWFQPLPNEAGRLSLAADHPGVADDVVQDSVDIFGVRFGSYDITERIYPYISVTNTILVQNLGDLPLAGLSASFDGLPGYLLATVSVSNSLPASGATPLTYTLVATNVVNSVVRTRLRITTSEGAIASVPVEITVQPLTTTLVSTPGFLDIGVVRGTQKVVEFDVSNIGGIGSGNISVHAPNLAWIALSSPSNLPTLGPGENTRVSLVLTPPANASLTLYQANVQIIGENGTLTIPMRLRTMSDGRGDLVVEVRDDYTYYVDGAPLVTNALVRLTDPYTGALIAEATSFPDGFARLTNIVEGTYQMRVTAEKHSSYAAPVEIAAGVQTDKSVFIDRQTVSYRWTVVPTTVEDRYQVVLEPVFETEVPIPVVTLDTPKFLLLIKEGGEGQIDVKLSNHGLVAAERVTITPPQHPLLEFEPLTPVVDVLPAKSSITIPVRVRHKGVPSFAAAGAPKNLGCGTTFTGCDAIPQMEVKWSWICGPDRRWHGLNAEVQFECMNTDCWERIEEFLKDKAEELRDALLKGETVNVKELPQEWACDLIELMAICAGVTDPCALALMRAACTVATGDVGGAGGAGAGLANCICPNISLPSLSSPPPGPPPSVPYYETRSGVGSPGSFGSPIEPIVFWDYEGADCEPGLHPAGGDAFAPAAAAGSADSTIQPFNDSTGRRPKASTQPDAVCARVRIRLEQEAAITRQAFLGALELDNETTDTILSGIQVTLDIRDERGTNVNDRFFIAEPELSVLTGIDGTGVLAPATSGSAKFTFIPTREAAPSGPKVYRFGGTLVYFAGAERVEVPLAPQTLTVYPDPVLRLDYFLQRDVFSDDPFTDEVEPAVPFALGLIVKNTGLGRAVDFRISSAQPEIIENEKGLLIDFKIIGTQVSTQSVSPSLALRLGDIEAGKSQVAAFWMTASLQGKFIEYSASFKHIDSLGGERTSLIDSVTLHELIHVVRAQRPGDDALMDFLANDLPDAQNFPDTLYMSDGSLAPVLAGSSGAVDGPVTFGDLQVTLTANMPSGWAYLRMPDPGANFRLWRVVRSDGREFLVGTNVWTTDRTFDQAMAGPVKQNLLHLLDHNSTGTYTLYYRVNDAVAPTITTVGAEVPAALTSPLSTIDVVMSETIDLQTFTHADLVLQRNGGANLITPAVTVAAVDTNVYRISGLAALTGTDGNYQLTVLGGGIEDFGGNRVANTNSCMWAKGSDVPVVVSITRPTPNPRNTAVAALDVAFSKAVSAASLGLEDLVLTRNGSANLIGAGVTITQLASNTFSVSGLETLTATEGEYWFAVMATGVIGEDSSVGQGSLAQTWTMLTTGPRIVSLEAPIPSLRNIVVQRLDVTFAQPIAPGTFTWNDLTLTRDGGPNLITSDVQVNRVSDTVYRLSNFTWVQGNAGRYTLTVSAAGVEDLAGNSGAGAASQSWTIELTKPAQPFNLAITPDLGISSADGRTASNSIVLSGLVGETNLTVRVYDDTLGVNLGVATVNGLTFSKPITFTTPSAHALRIFAMDEAQNVSSNVTFHVFVDQTPPSAVLETITPAARTNSVATVDVTLGEAVNETNFTRSAFTLKRNGGTNLLGTGVTLSKVSPTLYRLGNLASLNTAPGTYVLALDLTGVEDHAGNKGSGQVTTQWTLQGPTTNQPPVIAALTNWVVNEGWPLVMPISATDDPAQTITLTLGGTVPAGATITNSVFAWQPSPIQGGQTYRITVIAADSGQPSLTATQSFDVQVRDTLPDAIVSLSSTNLFPGGSSAVRVQLDSGIVTTNVTFDVEMSSAALKSFALQSPSIEVLGANLQTVSSNRARVELKLDPAGAASSSRTLVRLGFTAQTNRQSEIVNLGVNGVQVIRGTGASITNVAGQGGRVIIVGDEPVLEFPVDLGTNHTFQLYGLIGSSYSIERATVLGAGVANWAPVLSVQLSNTVQTVSPAAVPAPVYYRARKL